jgi:hypothetical protein
MKTLKSLTLSLAVAAFIMIAQSASAQTVNINSNQAISTVDAKTVSVTLNASGFKSQADADAFAAKIKSYNGIFKSEAKNYSANKADVVVTLPKEKYGMAIQKALEHSGIKTVNLDGKPVPVSQLVATWKAQHPTKK